MRFGGELEFSKCHLPCCPSLRTFHRQISGCRNDQVTEAFPVFFPQLLVPACALPHRRKYREIQLFQAAAKFVFQSVSWSFAEP